MLIESSVYEIIKKSMPIPCVDLIVIDKDGNILMLLRNNDPAKDQWWFPGGRVLFNERRIDAVHRKLKEECGLEATRIREIGTKDLILTNSDGTLSHAITTVFAVFADGEVILDDQSQIYEQKNAAEWLQSDLHAFLKNAITEAQGVIDER